MRKKFLVIMGVTMMTALMCTGCSSVAKEKDIKEDLEQFSEWDFLEKGEKIDKVVIEKRKTVKEQKEDTVWCVVTTKNSKVSREKEAVLYYHKYEKQGWLLDDIDLEDSDEWEIAPLKGITKKDIPSTLKGESVKTAEGSWKIKKSEIGEISIDTQKTDLKEKTDKVTMTVTLNGEVEKVKGTLIAEYKFTDKWELEKLSHKKEFRVESIPEKTLKVDENELIELLTKEILPYGEGASLEQEITIAKEEIADFKIENRESSSKGTEQILHCSCTLNKPYVVFGLQIDIPYSYHGEWEAQTMTVASEVKSVDLLGKWSGKNIPAGIPDNVVLDITNVEGDNITATYYFTPEEISDFKQPGSYHVSGTFDRKTLNMKLTAGEWIEKPDWDALVKQDIKAAINVNMGIIEGYGHHGDVFRVEKQE